MLAWPVLEAWRRRGRLAGVTATLTALCALAVILTALSSGLWAGATSAIGGSSAQQFVFSANSLDSFARSRLPLADAARVARLPGVAAVGALGTLTTVMTLPHGTADVAVIGTLPGRPGAPTSVGSGRLPGPGTGTGTDSADANSAVVDGSLRADGVQIGSLLRTTAGGPALRVTGFVSGRQYELLPTVWTSLTAWQALTAAAQPETRSTTPDAQVLTVRLAPHAKPAAVQQEISSLLGAAVVTVTRSQAMLAIPGAAAMRTTISELIAAALIVATGVTALFSALYVTERRAELGRLRALGASARRLALGMLIQAWAPAICATALAYLLAELLIAVAPPAFPVGLPIPDAAGLGALIALAATVGALVPAARIARIDPATSLEEL
jgi:putative ABC transport system permease protein